MGSKRLKKNTSSRLLESGASTILGEIKRLAWKLRVLYGWEVVIPEARDMSVTWKSTTKQRDSDGEFFVLPLSSSKRAKRKTT